MSKIIIDGEEYVKKSDCKKAAPESIHDNPFMEIGISYFIRTVTHYFTGRLIWVGDKEICLEDVCWIADTGRFNEFADGKTVNESEPFPKGARVIIGRGSIIDMVEHELILSVK
jgi:hypothetical protein